MARALHASHRIGVGHFTVAASRPFTARFFGRMDRSTRQPRPVALHLTVRLGDLEQFQAVLRALSFPPVQA